MTHAAAATRTLRSPRRRPRGPAAWERAGAVSGVVGASSFVVAPGLDWSAAWRPGAVALGVAAAIAARLVRRPAAARHAPAAGHDKPLRKAA